MVDIRTCEGGGSIAIRPEPPQSAPRTLGGWQVTQRLGEGGMGEVYLAHRGDCRAAIKVFKPGVADAAGTRRRVGREIAAGLSIASPSVASILDFDVMAPTPYIAWRYIEGPTLTEQVRTQGQLSGEELLQFGIGLAAGIAAISDAGVIHRDLKPSNILISDEGPVIIDLGIAATDSDSTLTTVGQVCGSPGWMAPEQLQGNPMVGATDVFGWGALMHFAATGERPFGEGNPAVLMYRITHGQRKPIGLTSPLARLVDRTLSTDQRERPSPQELVAGLAQLDATPATLQSVVRTTTESSRPAIVGRCEEIGRIWPEIVRTQRPVFWCVDGPVGIGKSRLLNAVAQLAREQGMQTLFLGEIDEPPVAPVDAIESFQYSIVVIDDLAAFERTADKKAGAEIDSILARGASVLAAVRTSAVHQCPQLVSLLGTLDRAQRLRRLTLGPLTNDASATLFDSASGGHPPPANLGERTGGNPLLVARLAATFIGNPVGPLLPLTGLELLGELREPARRVVVAAACLDREFSLAELAQIVPDATTLLDGFEECLHAGILAESSSGQFGSFRSDLVREQVMASTSAVRRRTVRAPLAKTQPLCVTSH